MAAFNFRRRQTRRGWYAGVTLAVAAFFAVFLVASSGAEIASSPSGFESSDGNMTIDGVTDPATHTDWNCFVQSDGFARTFATPTGCKVTSGALMQADRNAGTSNDVSWVSGQKMDLQCARTTTGNNPAKDTFNDVAQYNETDSGNNLYLYGATIRATANGNANENVELSQNPGTTACPINRTAGDKLLQINFGGSGPPSLQVLTYYTSADQFPTDVTSCYNTSTKAPPCWANPTTPANFEGAVGGGILAADNGMTGQPLVAGVFAEFGVNLTDALGLSTTSCTTFGQETWESRSSSSFSSNPQDIEIIPHSISNCGELIIRKQTSPRGGNQDFGFNSTIPNPNGTVSSSSSPYCQLDTSPNGTYAAPPGTGGFKLNDNGNTGTDNNASNTEDCKNLLQGTYTVTEDLNANYTLSNISCGVDGSGGSSTSIGTGSGGAFTTGTGTSGFESGDDTIQATLKPGDVITCTYTNTRKQGALLIQKDSAKTGRKVEEPGAQFCYSTATPDSNNDPVCDSSGIVVTDLGPLDTIGSTGDQSSTTGLICVAGLTPDTYYVNETGAPTGYGLVTTGQVNKSATVVNGTNCSTNLPDDQPGDNTGKVSFTDPPLADVIIAWRDGGSGETGISEGTPMTCTASNGTGTDGATGTGFGLPTGWTTSDAIQGVQIGSSNVTVTCTAVIDP